MGGGNLPKRIPHDWVERLYRQEEGPFTPPSWPASLPLQQCAIDEDKALKEVQQQCGMAALANSRALVCLEAILSEGARQASADPSWVDFPFDTLKEDIISQVATPLAHALHLAGGYFNGLSTRRRRRITKGIQDSQLSKWLEDSHESLTLLFPDNIAPTMAAAQAWQTDLLRWQAAQCALPRRLLQQLWAGLLGLSHTNAPLHASPFVGGTPARPGAGGASSQHVAAHPPPTQPLQSLTVGWLPIDQWPCMPRNVTDQVGGHPSLFIDQWSALGASEPVLQSIQGLALEFTVPPPLSHASQA